MTDVPSTALSAEEIAKTIKQHGAWLRSGIGGARADLTGADLTGADLSQAKGILDPIQYIADHFERDTEARGIIAYKAFGLHRSPPSTWQIAPGAVLTENVNWNRSYDCGCGVNVATREWIRANANRLPVWRVLIRWEWLVGVCVPMHTDGKIRCQRVELLDTITSE